MWKQFLLNVLDDLPASGILLTAPLLEASKDNNMFQELSKNLLEANGGDSRAHISYELILSSIQIRCEILRFCADISTFVFEANISVVKLQACP